MPHQDSVNRARRPATLCMSEGSYTRVEAQALREDVFDVLGADRFERRVVRALRDDDDRLALAHVAVLDSMM